MRNPLSRAALLILCAPLVAQDAGEIEFFKEAAVKLNAFATYSQKVGYPRQAKEIYHEVLAEYDENDPVARQALGFIAMGSSWAPSRDFVFPSEERPDPAIARLVSKRWKSVATFMGKGHRELALRLAKEHQNERASYHWDRVLRFVPNDPSASSAAGLENFEGLTGSPRDITILKRSRMMDRAIDRELKENYPVEKLPATERDEYLDLAGIDYIGVKSEHFTVWGNWQEGTLIDAARNAERCLAFCAEVFEGFEGYSDKKMIWTFAFFKEKQQWEQVLRANAKLFSGSELEFIVKNTAACAMGTGKKRMHIAGIEDADTIQDLAMRWVAQDRSGYRSDAFIEGIGHAVVGRFFGRNLVSSIAQQRQKSGTVSGASEERTLLMPDLASWEEAAIENAWRRDGTPVAELPLISAAQFPDDGRIKAWSFCDYMLRRSPDELRALDRTSGAKTQPNVIEQFAKAVEGGSVYELEDSWRRFWTEDSELINAIRNRVTPLEAFSKVAPKWLEAFNEARQNVLKTINAAWTPEKTDVGWSSLASADCKLHADYLKKNPSERGPANEQTEKGSAKGASNKGRAIAQGALISTKGSKPDKVMEPWMSWPGYRDALLNPNLKTVGLYVDGSIMVMDTSRGMPAQALMNSWHPTGNNRQLDASTNFAVPTSVELADLGPEVAELLKRKGHRVGKSIGYPITVHFFDPRAVPQASSISCTLLQGGEPVEGVLHVASGGRNRRASAPGLVVFYPLRPLKRGVEYEVIWDWPRGAPERFKFQTR